MSSNPTVRAAGGIVLRCTPGGDWQVLLVHRPRYDDWSLPKGKAEPGESDEETACREVQEETGYQCALGEEVASHRYVDRRGRDKQVRYWRMTVAREGAWAPNHEVDEIRWCTAAEASSLLTYARDQAVLDAFLAP